MHRTVLTISLSAAIFTAIATQGFATNDHKDPAGPRQSFEELDANADGLISPEEMQAKRADRFAQADTDGDGALTPAEMEARATAGAKNLRNRMLDHIFAKRDTDGDGRLTLAEMGEGRTDRLFAATDTDKDGLISQPEFDTFVEKRHAKRHKAE